MILQKVHLNNLPKAHLSDGSSSLVSMINTNAYYNPLQGIKHSLYPPTIVYWYYTVDREIFALKIIRVKIFHIDKFSRFCSIREIYLTVDDCNMDERLESLWLLVYY